MKPTALITIIAIAASLSVPANARVASMVERFHVEGQIYDKVQPKQHSGHFPRRVDFNTPRAFSTIGKGSVRRAIRYERGRNRQLLRGLRGSEPQQGAGN